MKDKLIWTIWFAILIIILVAVLITSTEPNKPNEPMEPNEPAIDIDSFAGYYDPNNILYYFAEFGLFEFQDGMYTEDLDLYSNVTFCLGCKDWAVFKRKRDGVISCNVTKEEFIRRLPECIYDSVSKTDPNLLPVIEWAEPNEPDFWPKDANESDLLFIDTHYFLNFTITCENVNAVVIDFNGDEEVVVTGACEEGGHNIYLGEGAGLDLTDESYQFIINVCGDMLQTTMTPDEYQTIYDVVNRAIKETNNPNLISLEKYD